MRVFALSDLHLGHSVNKPMDKFGGEWENHAEKIQTNWNSIVRDNDIVLIPGDISWAMGFNEAEKDILFIKDLKGNKVLLRGNHDYWWSSVSRLNGLYAKSGMYFLQNDCFMLPDGKTAICGARLWKKDSTEAEDIKIFRREVIRAKLSLDAAMRKKCEKIIFMSHYPPLLFGETGSDICELFKNYPIIKAIYGHLHGADNFKTGFQGIIEKIEYKLVSADYVNFTPQLIFEEE